MTPLPWHIDAVGGVHPIAYCWCGRPLTASTCQNEVVADLRQRRPSVEQISRIGMDNVEAHFSDSRSEYRRRASFAEEVTAHGEGGVLQEAAADGDCDRSVWRIAPLGAPIAVV